MRPVGAFRVRKALGRTLLSAVVAACCWVSSCRATPQADPDRRRAELEALRAILEMDRQAHLRTDAPALVSNLADTLVDVADGEISFQTRDEVEESFAAYLDGAEYRVWEDMEAPIIRLSEDLTMAWVARRVRVARDEPDGEGGTRRSQFVGAWISTYEKRDGEWKMTAVASTFAPPDSQ
jgi:hypothetical protein